MTNRAAEKIRAAVAECVQLCEEEQQLHDLLKGCQASRREAEQRLRRLLIDNVPSDFHDARRLLVGEHLVCYDSDERVSITVEEVRSIEQLAEHLANVPVNREVRHNGK